ncbi:Hpt domain-containing protein [Tsuneonella sp. HG222]
MSEIEPRLERLRQRYLERLAREMAELEAIARGRPTLAELQELQRIAHKLAGISGSLGFESVSTAAQKLDRDWSTSAADLTVLCASVSELRQIADTVL